MKNRGKKKVVKQEFYQLLIKKWRKGLLIIQVNDIHKKPTVRNLENDRKFLERQKHKAQNKKEIIHKLFSETKVANKTTYRYK